MARTLKQVIEAWEAANMVNVSTASLVRRGAVKTSPLMAKQIAIAFGATESEATEIAARYPQKAKKAG